MKRIGIYAVAGWLVAGAGVVSAQELLGEYWKWTTQPANSARPPGAPGDTANHTRIDFSDVVADAPPIIQWLSFLDPTIFTGGNEPPDNFFALYTGFIMGPTTGNVTFNVLADDGVELQINGTVVATDWTTHAPRDANGTFAMQQGIWYPIRLAFFEGGVTSRLRLDWSYQGQARVTVPSANFSLSPPAPPAPLITGSQAGDLFSTYNNFQWSYSGAGTAFNIYINGALATTVPITTLSYTDTSANAYNVQTCYTVAAINGVVGPQANPQACLTPLPPPPRTNDHDEGIFEDKCACGSSVPASGGAALALAAVLLASVAVLGRR